MNLSLYHYKAVVKSVYDADTITVDISLGCGVWIHGERLRLFGINAPEMRGPEKPKGIISRDWLREQLFINIAGEESLGHVIIQTIKDKKGKYGRLLAIIYKSMGNDSWVNLNEQMVKLGLAVKKDY